MAEEHVTTQEKKEMSRSRRKVGLWALGIGLLFVPVSRWIIDLIALVTGRSVAEIADMGPDIYAPLFAAVPFASAGLLFSFFAGWLAENHFKQNSFGAWSRRGIGFLVGAWLYSMAVSALL